MQIRLNKYLSNSGVLSRRKTDEFLANGKITINGIKAILGATVDPETDKIQIDGKDVTIAVGEYQYIMLNKPLNVLSTTSDDRGRKTVLDLITEPHNNLYPVGRLDYNSTGLILLTNDGDFALKITHPRYHLPKTYIVGVQEKIFKGHIESLKNGVLLDGKRTLPSKVIRLNDHTFKITLFQGIKRQIREMCRKLNLTVKSIHRTDIGGINIGTLRLGDYRHLTPNEVESLKREIAH